MKLPRFRGKRKHERNSPALFDKLPDELLALVFRLTIPPEGIVMGDFSEPPTSQALALVQVSSRWRGVGLLDPILWANLKVQLVHWRDTFHNWSKAFILHLERSQNAPLAITLDLPFNWNVPEGAQLRELEALCSAISQHHGRIEHFKTTSMYETWNRIYPFTETQGQRTVPLKSLSLGMLTAQEIQKNRPSFTQTSFPALRHLCIDYVPRDSTFLIEFENSLPWAQITSLRFSVVANCDIPSILSACRNLTTLDITLKGDPGNHSPPSWYSSKTEMILSFVTQLHVRLYHRRDSYVFAQQLFSLLSCPSLTSLVLGHEIIPYRVTRVRKSYFGQVEDNARQIHESMFEAVETFLSERSNCINTLTSLRIEEVVAPDASLSRLLRITTPLKHFYFLEVTDTVETNQWMDGSFLREFYEHDGFLPNLRTLGVMFTGEWVSNETLRMLESALRSRSAVRGGRLHSVRVNLPRHIHPSAPYPLLDLSPFEEIQKSSDIALSVRCEGEPVIGYAVENRKTDSAERRGYRHLMRRYIMKGIRKVWKPRSPYW